MLAAGLALILATVFLWLNQTPSNADLYAQYYEVYPNIEIPLERGNESQILEALQNYETGDYGFAAKGFEELVNEDSSNAAWVFYLATSQLESGEKEKARNNFQKVIDLGQTKYLNPARWYLALTQISMNQTEEAEGLLKILIEEDFGYKVRAEQLLNSISD
jgi:predicted Zn-dependent protease